MIIALNLIALISGMVAAYQISLGKHNFLTSTTIYCVVMLALSIYLQIYAEAIFFVATIFVNVAAHYQWKKNSTGTTSKTLRMKRSENIAILIGVPIGLLVTFGVSYAIQQDSNQLWIIIVDSFLFTVDIAALSLMIKKKSATPWFWLVIDVSWLIYLSYVVFGMNDMEFLLLLITRVYFFATTVVTLVLWKRQLEPKKKQRSFYNSNTIPSMSVKSLDKKVK